VEWRSRIFTTITSRNKLAFFLRIANGSIVAIACLGQTEVCKYGDGWSVHGHDQSGHSMHKKNEIRFPILLAAPAVGSGDGDPGGPFSFNIEKRHPSRGQLSEPAPVAEAVRCYS
jgi:hypothetical protein